MTLRQQLAVKLAASALPFMCERQAAELANNVACWTASTPDLAAEIARAIRTRLEQCWAECSDVDACAGAMAATFRRWVGCEFGRARKRRAA